MRGRRDVCGYRFRGAEQADLNWSYLVEGDERHADAMDRLQSVSTDETRCSETQLQPQVRVGLRLDFQ